MDLSDALELGKFTEYQGNGLANPAVRVQVDAVMSGLHVTDSHRQKQLAAFGFLAQGLE